MTSKPVAGDVRNAGHQALARALPDALARAVEVYRAHALAEIPDDAKALQQHQAACKAALAHIEALLKLDTLATMTATDDDGAGGDIVTRAEAAYRAYTEDGNDDGGPADG